MLHCEMQIVLGFFSLVPQVRCEKRGTHLLSRFLQPLKSLAIRVGEDERKETKHQTILVTINNVGHDVLLQIVHTLSLFIVCPIIVLYYKWLNTNLRKNCYIVL